MKQNVTRTVSTKEAKNQLSKLIAWTQKKRREIVIQKRGQPSAVLMPFGEYSLFLKQREKAKRKALWREWQQLAQQVSARNQDLTPEQADALADRFVRDVIDDMVKEGKIVYESES